MRLGILCPTCAEAVRRDAKRYAYDAAHGRPALVSSMGTLRRIEALQCNGHTLAVIADYAGVPEATLRTLMRRRQPRVRRVLAEGVTDAYRDMSRTRGTTVHAERVARIARERGWRPPPRFGDLDLSD